MARIKFHTNTWAFTSVCIYVKLTWTVNRNMYSGITGALADKETEAMARHLSGCTEEERKKFSQQIPWSKNTYHYFRTSGFQRSNINTNWSSRKILSVTFF